MGKLPEPIYEKLMLPSTAGQPDADWVEINLNPLGGDMIVALTGVGDESASDGEKTMSLFSSLIRSWSFVDDSGQSVPITPENVRRISLADLNFLAEKLAPVLENIQSGGLEEKKDETSSSSSHLQETEAPSTSPPR